MQNKEVWSVIPWELNTILCLILIIQHLNPSLGAMHPSLPYSAHEHMSKINIISMDKQWHQY